MYPHIGNGWRQVLQVKIRMANSIIAGRGHPVLAPIWHFVIRVSTVQIYASKGETISTIDRKAIKVVGTMRNVHHRKHGHTAPQNLHHG